MAMRGDLKEQVGWYEATLPLKERRNRGHFSTPPRLVEHILDACGYTADKNLTHMRVLDSACGSGNFLAEVARRLASFGVRNNLPQKEIAGLIQRSYGRDIASDANAAQQYKEAYFALKRGDHYLLIMIDQALKRHLQPWWKFVLS